MRRKPSQLFGIGYVVYHGHCFPKGCINVHWTDEFDGIALESQRSKNRKRMKVVKFQDRPAMNTTEPGGDTTKISVMAMTDAIESLLLALFSHFSDNTNSNQS
jgi:hypothetical protein